MANISPIVNRAVQGAQSVAKVSWALATTDVGLPIELTDHADRSVQVSGAFGGGTVVIEGSNDGVDWFTLRDPQGSTLSFTTAGLKQVMETTLYTRASVAGGAAVAVTVIMCLRIGSAISWSR